MTSWGDPAAGPWEGKVDGWTINVRAAWFGEESAILTATIERLPFAPAWETTMYLESGMTFRDAIKDLLDRVAMDLPSVRGGPDRDDVDAWLDSDEMMTGE